MLKTTYKPSAPLPPGWTEHTAPSGHKYYYNASTKQSTYTRPQVAQATTAQEEELHIDYNATAPDASLHATAQALDQFYQNADPRKWQHSQNQNRGQQPDRSRRGHGGDRPKSKKPIPGAEPWLLVTTKFGRRFVHNTDTKQSLWKFPQDVMLAVIDLDRAEWERKQRGGEAEGEEKDEAERKTDEHQPAAKLADTLQRGSGGDGDGDGDHDQDSSSEYEEVEVTDDENEEDEVPAAAGSKRPRLDEGDDKAVAGQNAGPLEMNEDDIEWQLAQLETQEGSDDYDNDNDDEDDTNNRHNDDDDDGTEGLDLTAEDNVALFRSLLDDFGISPYATFDKITENVDLVEDRRYVALPNMRTRRDVFTAWAAERVQAIQVAKARDGGGGGGGDDDDPTVAYLTFLHRHATPKLYWPEFRRKFRREAAMQRRDLSDRDRERLYRELTGKLRLGEPERRRHLLALLQQHGACGGKGDVPLAVRRDVRYYLVEAAKRDEIVDDFART